MRFSLWAFFILLVGAEQSFAQSKRWAYFELGGSYGYHRQVYGLDRESKHTSETYSGTMAVYILSFLALEASYSHEEENIVTNTNIDLGGNQVLKHTHQRIYTQVFSGGLRFALAPRNFILVPSISAGYAKQFKQSNIKYTIEDSTTTEERQIIIDFPKQRIDSVFGTFALAINLSRRIQLTGSVTTVFKYFETERAKDNIKYLAGFRCIF